MRFNSIPALMVVFFWSVGWICIGPVIGAEIEAEVDLTAAAAPTITVRGEKEPASLFEDESAMDTGNGSDLLEAGQTVTSSKTGLIEIHIESQEITKILKLLSLQSQRNIIASQNVAGSVSADLYGVDFYEAMEAVLHANGFGYVEKGNFIYVYTAEELAAITVVERKAVTRVRRLNYISALYASAVVSPMLSAQGSVAVNEAVAAGIQATVGDLGGSPFVHRETVVVRDYQDNLDEIMKVLDELDVRPPQILIEATVLDVRLTEDNAFGTDLNVVIDNNFGVFPSVLNAVDDLITGAVGTTDNPVYQELGNSSAVSSTPGNTATGDSTIKVGVVSKNVSVFIRALDRVSDTTVIARPKLTVLNRRRGSFLVGARLGYLSTTATETSTTQTVEFLEVGTQLTVQPSVLEDDVIHLAVNPSVSDGTTTSVGGVVIPNETTTSVLTEAICRSGQTIVLAGLFKEDTIISRDQVPGLGDSIIGAAFRGQDDKVRRSEVIFLIKPTVMKDKSLIAGGNAALAGADLARLGAREGLLVFSRTKQVAAHMRDAMHYYEQGDEDKALLYAKMALRLDPTFVQARRMKEEITGHRDHWPEHSILKDSIDAMVNEQQQAIIDSAPALTHDDQVDTVDAVDPLPAVVETTEVTEVVKPEETDETVAEQEPVEYLQPISIESDDSVESAAPVAPAAPEKVKEAPATVIKITVDEDNTSAKADEPTVTEAVKTAADDAGDSQAQVPLKPVMFNSLINTTRLQVITNESDDADKVSTQMLLNAVAHWLPRSRTQK